MNNEKQLHNGEKENSKYYKVNFWSRELGSNSCYLCAGIWKAKSAEQAEVKAEIMYGKDAVCKEETKEVDTLYIQLNPQITVYDK